MPQSISLKTSAVVLTLILAAGPLSAAAGSKQPNILWLTSEDNSVSWLGCYGNKQATSPNIDRLASQGFLYEHCYANAPVCAPSRSTWITGIHAISSGTHPMRSRRLIPHGQIKYYPDYLRKAGYYVTNHRKTDFNIGGRKDSDCWNSSEKYGWRKRQKGQPFFCIINITTSHESRAQGSVENTKHDPANTTLRKYHPDLPVIRKNYAKYHDAVEKMDQQIGEVLAELEKDGLAEETIVVYCSDHGGVLPRSKRFLYNSGTHCPLIVRIPEQYKPWWPADRTGSRIKRLVSFIDMPKTWLSLAGAEVPKVMQGRIFLGPKTEPERKFHFSWRGRMDERMDNVRAVRDTRYLYIKNYMPFAPAGQHLNYLWKMAATRAWQEHFQAGKTDATTSRFFLPKPAVEELYDTQADPDNVNNLIDDPQYAQVADKMRKALRGWQLTIHDSALIPESELDRLAGEKNVTPYEFVRNEKLYDLPAYLNAADLALAQSRDNLPKLLDLLQNQDPGLRYWGATGCFLLKDDAAVAKEPLTALLADQSHEVRAMAAWTLYRLGEKEKCYACLGQLLDQGSYATLKVLNMVDWMGKDGKTLLPKVAANKPKGNYENRMRSYLLSSQQ